MNREIKFRNWLKNEKGMLNDISSIKLDIKCIYYDNNDLFSYERKSFDEIELMQYTGLKDKNGVEIYEGDIVRFTTGTFTSIGIVGFWSGMFQVEDIEDDECTEILCYCDELEVLGNRFENPELLEAK